MSAFLWGGTTTASSRKKRSPKTNEIPRLAALLHDVPLVGVRVTGETLHTQDDTARHLEQERGTDDLAVVKAKQPVLRKACAQVHQ